jgi:PKD repeat protein
VRFAITAKDRERNLSELRLDFGDGSSATGYTAADLPHRHAYARPGTYTAKLSVVDYYLKRASSSIAVKVTAPP